MYFIFPVAIKPYLIMKYKSLLYHSLTSHLPSGITKTNAFYFTRTTFHLIEPLSFPLMLRVDLFYFIPLIYMKRLGPPNCDLLRSSKKGSHSVHEEFISLIMYKWNLVHYSFTKRKISNQSRWLLAYNMALLARPCLRLWLLTIWTLHWIVAPI